MLIAKLNSSNVDRSKISELQAYAIKSKPDVIVLNETWFKNSISNSPTRKNGNTLDVLLSYSGTSIDNLQVLDAHSICKSDHFPLTCSIKTSFSRKRTLKRSVYNFKKANLALINLELCSINWTFLNSTHPDSAWKSSE
jgi:hypothetical protein